MQTRFSGNSEEGSLSATVKKGPITLPLGVVDQLWSEQQASETARESSSVSKNKGAAAAVSLIHSGSTEAYEADAALGTSGADHLHDRYTVSRHVMPFRHKHRF